MLRSAQAQTSPDSGTCLWPRSRKWLSRHPLCFMHVVAGELLTCTCRGVRFQKQRKTLRCRHAAERRLPSAPVLGDRAGKNEPTESAVSRSRQSFAAASHCCSKPSVSRLWNAASSCRGNWTKLRCALQSRYEPWRFERLLPVRAMHKLVTCDKSYQCLPMRLLPLYGFSSLWKETHCLLIART